ncbi:hypothetical protein T484DRAFT_2302576 [Baffinella frigidus]|nr:hypothetical protein T484DRAFT_2302576 [Cryptophyta sp. CCMP2293]
MRTTASSGSPSRMLRCTAFIETLLEPSSVQDPTTSDVSKRVIDADLCAEVITNLQVMEEQYQPLEKIIRTLTDRAAQEQVVSLERCLSVMGVLNPSLDLTVARDFFNARVAEQGSDVAYMSFDDLTTLAVDHHEITVTAESSVGAAEGSGESSAVPPKGKPPAALAAQAKEGGGVSRGGGGSSGRSAESVGGWGTPALSDAGGEADGGWGRSPSNARRKEGAAVLDVEGGVQGGGKRGWTIEAREEVQLGLRMALDLFWYREAKKLRRTLADLQAKTNRFSSLLDDFTSLYKNKRESPVDVVRALLLARSLVGQELAASNEDPRPKVTKPKPSFFRSSQRKLNIMRALIPRSGPGVY